MNYDKKYSNNEPNLTCKFRQNEDNISTIEIAENLIVTTTTEAYQNYSYTRINYTDDTIEKYNDALAIALEWLDVMFIHSMLMARSFFFII